MLVGDFGLATSSSLLLSKSFKQALGSRSHTEAGGFPNLCYVPVFLVHKSSQQAAGTSSSRCKLGTSLAFLSVGGRQVVARTDHLAVRQELLLTLPAVMFTMLCGSSHLHKLESLDGLFMTSQCHRTYFQKKKSTEEI
eukprot:5384378-Amphidinium_carterae.1